MKKTIIWVVVGISVALLIFGSIFYEFCKDIERCGTEYCLYKMLFDTIKAIGALLAIGLSILYWYFLGEKTDSFLKKQKKWVSYLCLAIFAILLSRISISEKISSKLMVSISRAGSTDPST